MISDLVLSSSNSQCDSEQFEVRTLALLAGHLELEGHKRFGANVATMAAATPLLGAWARRAAAGAATAVPRGLTEGGQQLCHGAVDG